MTPLNKMVDSLFEDSGVPGRKIQFDEKSIEEELRPLFEAPLSVCKQASVSTNSSPKPKAVKSSKPVKNCKRDAKAKHAMRADTICKTLLRAVKRHFCVELCGGNKFVYKSNKPEEFNKVLENIDKVSMDGYP